MVSDTQAGLAIRINVIGPITVQTGAQTLSGTQIGSRKSRQLLMALALENPRRLNVDQLVDRLWGEDAPEKASRNISTLVSRLRALLGASLIEGDARSGYQLGPIAAVDFTEAEEHLMRLDAVRSRNDAQAVLDAATEAADLLCSGEIAADELEDSSWLAETRRQQAAAIRVARSLGWRAALALDELESAHNFSAEAFNLDPFDEDAARALMTAEARLGRRNEVINCYRRLRDELSTELDVEPSQETEALFKQLTESPPVTSLEQPTIDQLGENDLVMGCAALLGQPFTAENTSALSSLDVIKVHAHLSAAARQGTVTAQGTRFSFKSHKERQAALEGLGPALQTSLHRRGAQLFANDPAVAARHLGEAGDWDSATAAWLKASSESMSAFDPRKACELLSSAAAAAKQLGDGVREAEILLERGLVREHLGDYEEALDDHARAVDLARAGAALELESAALERTAWTLYFARNGPLGSNLTDRALPLCEQIVRSPNAQPSARILLGRLRHATGDVDGAAAVLEGPELDGLDDQDKVTAGLCLGILRAHTDRYQDAFDQAERAASLGRQTGQYRHVLTATFVSVLAALNSGWLGAALDRLEMMTALAKDFEDEMYQVRAATMGALIWYELGDIGRASDLADESMSRVVAAGAGATHSGIHAQMAAAEIELGLAEHPSAVQLSVLDQAAGEEVAYRWRLELRRLELLSRAEPERAVELLDAAVANGSDKYAALALQHLGREEAALQRALPLSSDLLLSNVGPIESRSAARDRIARTLPVELRGPYVQAGTHLAR